MEVQELVAYTMNVSPRYQPFEAFASPPFYYMEISRHLESDPVLLRNGGQPPQGRQPRRPRRPRKCGFARDSAAFQLNYRGRVDERLSSLKGSASSAHVRGWSRLSDPRIRLLGRG